MAKKRVLAFVEKAAQPKTSCAVCKNKDAAIEIAEIVTELIAQKITSATGAGLHRHLKETFPNYTSKTDATRKHLRRCLGDDWAKACGEA